MTSVYLINIVFSNLKLKYTITVLFHVTQYFYVLSPTIMVIPE